MSAYHAQSYLALLAQGMRLGLEPLKADEAAQHASLVRRFWQPAGGFSGRRGGADLYYTTFGTRVLHALNKLDAATTRELNGYLDRVAPANLIDVANLLELGLLLVRSPVPAEGLLQFAERFRTQDGGYGKTAGAERGSTYHSFLAALAYDLMGQRPPDQDGLRRFVGGRQRPDGGFCEDAPTAHGSSNATAAGVALLVLLAGSAETEFQATANFLLTMQDESGGWLAVPRAPMPDLLSTYTALLSLMSAGALTPEILGRAQKFLATCACSGGGFCAGPWDTSADAEYTYYGLGIWALCQQYGLTQ